MHLRTNNQAILTRLVCLPNLLIFIVLSCCVCHFPLKLASTLPTDREAESFHLYYALLKSDTVINGDFPLYSAPLGLQTRKWESTESQEVFMAQDGKLSDLLGQLQSAVELNETAQSKTTVGFHCDHNKVCFLWDREKNISVIQTVEDGNMRWQFQLVFQADSGSYTDKWSTYGSLVTVILNNDSNNHEINPYWPDTK